MRILIFLSAFLFLTTISSAQLVTVNRVIDGDTIIVTTREGQEEKVHLLGIDAPETKINDEAKAEHARTGLEYATINKMGEEAAWFLKKLLRNKEVFLVYDEQQKDDRGTSLAYVFMFEPSPKIVPHDWGLNARKKWLQKGVFEAPPPHLGFDLNVNSFVILNGYAHPKILPPNVKYEQLFNELYKDAIKNQRGLWRIYCKDKKECQRLNCSHYDNPIKTGYQPDCIDGYCRCMCYGCH